MAVVGHFGDDGLSQNTFIDGDVLHSIALAWAPFHPLFAQKISVYSLCRGRNLFCEPICNIDKNFACQAKLQTIPVFSKSY